MVLAGVRKLRAAAVEVDDDVSGGSVSEVRWRSRSGEIDLASVCFSTVADFNTNLEGSLEWREMGVAVESW